MVNDTVCSLFVFRTLGRGWRAGETQPVVLLLCAGPWPFCLGLGYLLVGKLLVKPKWSKQLDGEVGGQNKQKEQIKGGTGKVFRW